MDFTDLIVNVVSSDGFSKIIIGIIGTIATWFIAKMSLSTQRANKVEQAKDILSAAVLQTQPIAQELKDRRAVYSTDPTHPLSQADKEDLNVIALKKAQEIGKQAGVDVGKILAPEIAKVVIENSVNNLKDKVSIAVGKEPPKLPSSVSAIMPLIPFMLVLGLIGCATYPGVPEGWVETDAYNVLSVSNQVADYLSNKTESMGREGQMLSSTSAVIAVAYLAPQNKESSKELKALSSMAAANKYARTNFSDVLKGVSFEEYLIERFEIQPGLKPSEIVLGFVKASCEEWLKTHARP